MALWGGGEDHTDCFCPGLWEIPEAVARKFRERKLMIAAATFCFVVLMFRNFGHLFPH